MAYWIEVYCDFKMGGSETIDLGTGCLSQRGDNPGIMTDERPGAGASHLHKLAREKGWRRKYDLWACPYCLSCGAHRKSAGVIDSNTTIGIK